MLDVIKEVIRQEELKTVELYTGNVLREWYSLPKKGIIEDMLLDISNKDNEGLSISVTLRFKRIIIAILDNNDNIDKEYIFRFKDAFRDNALLER